MQYNSTEGPIELWTLLYLSPPTKTTSKRLVLHKIIFKVPEGTTAALRAYELKRTLKGPAAIPEWDEMREATGDEVSIYFSRHPNLLSKHTDPRASRGV